MLRTPKFLIGFEFTNHCNFRCLLCPQSHHKKETDKNRFDREKGFISDEVLDSVIPQLNKYAKRVTFGCFGEPLLHPRFNEIMKKIKNGYNKGLIINTNGSLMTKDNWKGIKLVKEIRISLDSPVEETWNKLCPGGPVFRWNGTIGHNRYKTLVNKIKYVLSLKNRPKINLIYVKSSNNYFQEHKFLSYWFPLLRSGDCVLTKSAITFGGIVTDPYMKKSGCDIYKIRRIVIGWNGDCTPCNLDMNFNMKIGNLKNQTIKEIINSKKYKNIMKNIKKHNGMCVHCFDGGNHSIRVFKR